MLEALGYVLIITIPIGWVVYRAGVAFDAATRPANERLHEEE